ncbi:hypothetical protein [Geothermobacter ehrlichii]|nr:hypothetical protein [Geothermobacter ehrlichii]
MTFDKDKWLHKLQLSSIPLRKLNEELMPIGIASGCLIDYLGKRIILSVFHATKRDANWVIEIKYEEQKGTQIYRPGGFNYLGEMKLGSSEIKEIDFSYTEVASDLCSFFQEITPKGKILSETTREIFSPKFDILPSKEETYGFSGQVMAEMHGNHTLATEHRVYPDLKYERTENGYHQFKLPFSHPGHEHFRGCSGAPILDTKGNVVALVCHGEVEKNSIYGISLARYKLALDITFGDLTNA